MTRTPANALLGLALVTLLFLSGCASTSTLYSNTFVKPAAPINRINVLYVENRLQTQGTNSNYDLYDVGYTDLPELLKERVPLVFGMNDVQAECASFKRAEFNKSVEAEAVKWASAVPGTMVLSLQVIDGKVVSGSHTPRTTTLNIQANLTDPQTRFRQWTGQFSARFVAPPVGKSGFDNASVDHLLKKILEQLAKDGFITLKDGQAAIPDAQPAKADRN